MLKGYITSHLVFAFCTLLATCAGAQAICKADERVLSQVSAVARIRSTLVSPEGCTAALIGRSCMISVAHCLPNLGVVEFEVPLSSVDGSLIASSPKQVYFLKDIVGSNYETKDDDWVVFTVGANVLTNAFPGDIYTPLKVRLSTAPDNAAVAVIGYGLSSPGIKQQVQQVSNGTNIKSERLPNTLRYDAYTEGGNSGSPVVLMETGEIIGIHKNGGCIKVGVSLAKNFGLQQAIKKCLASP